MAFKLFGRLPMPAFRASRVSNTVDALFSASGRGLILLVPAGLLAVAAWRSWDPVQKPWLLIAGLAFQMIVCALTFQSSRNQAIGPSIVTLYLTGVAWLWFGDGVNDSFTHLCKGVLIGFAVLGVGYQTPI